MTHRPLQLTSVEQPCGYGGSLGGSFDNNTGVLFTQGTWINVLGSVDLDAGLVTLLINEAPGGTYTGSPSGTIVFNGKSFNVGGEDPPQTGDTHFVGDIADLWIAPGVSLLDGNGDIATSTRRKFIDASGKPVDLGAQGELPTGTAPAVFLSGDASSFSTNQGTGGTFTLTGILVDATSSPSD